MNVRSMYTFRSFCHEDNEDDRGRRGQSWGYPIHRNKYGAWLLRVFGDTEAVAKEGRLRFIVVHCYCRRRRSPVYQLVVNLVETLAALTSLLWRLTISFSMRKLLRDYTMLRDGGVDDDPNSITTNL